MTSGVVKLVSDKISFRSESITGCLAGSDRVCDSNLGVVNELPIRCRDYLKISQRILSRIKKGSFQNKRVSSSRK